MLSPEISILADICQILSLPLAVWGLFLALQKKASSVPPETPGFVQKKISFEKSSRTFFLICTTFEEPVRSFNYYI